MKNKKYAELLFLFTALIVFSQSSFAATVDGNAFKANQTTDHSGITVQLETLPGVPSTGFIGVTLFWVD